MLCSDSNNLLHSGLGHPTLESHNAPICQVLPPKVLHQGQLGSKPLEPQTEALSVEHGQPQAKSRSASLMELIVSPFRTAIQHHPRFQALPGIMHQEATALLMDQLDHLIGSVLYDLLCPSYNE